jgi:DNA invertase Pin-like site-specific DNA recombinase
MSSSSPVAYSYIRFSHPSQAEGDSLRRQAETSRQWCDRHGVHLDTSLTLHDKGVSGYTGAHRQNPDRHALAAFLKLVEQGKVPRGSYLILENLDRLSREHIQPALLLALNLLQNGIRLVQLKPTEMVFDDKSEGMAVMMMVMELSRGHGESAIKSERNGKAWVEKRRKARQSGEVLTSRLPAWIEKHGNKLRLIPERAAVVKRIFEMAASGYGYVTILKRLTAEKVPPFGPSKRWVRTYLFKILKDRRAVGELPPRLGKEGEDGEPIRGYYPAAVTEAEWYAAQEGISRRRTQRGRVSEQGINVFGGLLFDARDGSKYYVFSQTNGRTKGRRRRALINAAGARGLGSSLSFPFPTFEAAVLSALLEIPPHEILNGDQGPDETIALAGELAEVESSLAAIEADMDAHGESPRLFQRLRAKEARKAELVELLDQARQKAAHPLSEAWGEAQSLLLALESAPDPEDARLRLRAALRRMVDGIWVLVIPRGMDRLAAVQIWFAGGKKHRDYLILHQNPKANQHGRSEGRWWCRSLSTVTKAGQLDLRQRRDAAALEKLLLAVDVDKLAERMSS